MSFLGSYFVYNGISSKDFELRLMSINVNLNEVPSGSGIEINNTQVMRNPQRLFLGIKENQVLEFPIEIVSKKAIDFPTFLRIKQWLFGVSEYKRLQIEDDWYCDFYFNCIIKANEDIKFNGEYYGLRCNVECDSPYAYSFPLTQEYKSDGSASQDFTFDNYSAEIYGLKPIIEFKMSDKGNDFAIQNLTTSRIFKMTSLNPNEIITVDNKNQIIKSEIETNISGGTLRYTSGINRFKNLARGANQGYFYLTHGINRLRCEGNWKYLKITYQNAVRLGGG